MSPAKDPAGMNQERRRRAHSSKARYERVSCRPPLSNQMLEVDLSECVAKCLSDVSADMIIRLLHEFDLPAAVFILAPKIVSLGIPEKTVRALLDLIHELKYAIHEKQPICTSILLVPEDVNLTQIGQLTSSPGQSLHMAERLDFLSFAQCADGFRSGVLVVPSGEVLGIYSFHRGYSPPDPLLPERYRGICGASASSSGLSFLFGGSGRVCVFQEGRRILSHRGTTWHVHTDDIRRLIDDLSRQHALDSALVTEVVRLAFRVSDEGQGALLTIGDHKTVLDIYAMKNRTRDLSAIRIGGTPDEDLVLLMSQDGATVIKSDCTIVAAEGFLRPPARTPAEEEPHRGVLVQRQLDNEYFGPAE